MSLVEFGQTAHQYGPKLARRSRGGMPMSRNKWSSRWAIAFRVAASSMRCRIELNILFMVFSFPMVRSRRCFDGGAFDAALLQPYVRKSGFAFQMLQADRNRRSRKRFNIFSELLIANRRFHDLPLLQLKQNGRDWKID